MEIRFVQQFGQTNHCVLLAQGAVPLGLLFSLLTPQAKAQEAYFPQPSALTYDSGRIDAEATISPLMQRLLGRTLQREIPSVVKFAASEVAGDVRLTPESMAPVGHSPAASLPSLQTSILGQDRQQLADSKAATPLELFTPALNQALGKLSDRYNLPAGLTMEQFNTIFRYRILGTVTLSPQIASQTQLKSFPFSYNNQQQTLAPQELRSTLLKQCQWQTCIGAIAGELEIDLQIQGLLNVSHELGFPLPQSVQRLLQQASDRQLMELDFATGKVDATLKTHPKLSAAPSQSLANPVTGQTTVTQGHFALHAQRSTLPWSLLFSLPISGPISGSISGSTPENPAISEP